MASLSLSESYRVRVTSSNSPHFEGLPKTYFQAVRMRPKNPGRLKRTAICNSSQPSHDDTTIWWDTSLHLETKSSFLFFLIDICLLFNRLSKTDSRVSVSNVSHARPSVCNAVPNGHSAAVFSCLNSIQRSVRTMSEPGSARFSGHRPQAPSAAGFHPLRSDSIRSRMLRRTGILDLCLRTLLPYQHLQKPRRLLLQLQTRPHHRQP